LRDANFSPEAIEKATRDVDRLQLWLRDGHIFSRHDGETQLRPTFGLNKNTPVGDLKDANSLNAKVDPDDFFDSDIYKLSDADVDALWRSDIYDVDARTSEGKRLDAVERSQKRDDKKLSTAVKKLLLNFADDEKGTVSTFDALLLSVAAIAVLKIANDRGSEITSFLGELEIELDLELTGELLEKAGEALFVGLAQYGALALLTGGAGPLLKLALDAISSLDDVLAVLQLVEIAFPA